VHRSVCGAGPTPDGSGKRPADDDDDDTGKGEAGPASKRPRQDSVLPYAPNFVPAGLRTRLLAELGTLTKKDGDEPLAFLPRLRRGLVDKDTNRVMYEAKNPSRYVWFVKDGVPGLADAPYAFNRSHGNPLEPQPFFPALEELRLLVEPQLLAWDPERGANAPSFNAALFNFYESGDVALSAHKDDDAWFGDPADLRVASVSFGAERRFFLQHDTEKMPPGNVVNGKVPRSNAVKYQCTLGDSSLVAMLGDAQLNWKHGILPRTQKEGACGPRLNITFRAIDPELIAKQMKRTGVARSKAELAEEWQRDFAAREAPLRVPARTVADNLLARGGAGPA
jgi:alkylated DNA repair dioxygenase AlkB